MYKFLLYNLNTKNNYKICLMKYIFFYKFLAYIIQMFYQFICLLLYTSTSPLIDS